MLQVERYRHVALGVEHDLAGNGFAVSVARGASAGPATAVNPAGAATAHDRKFQGAGARLDQRHLEFRGALRHQIAEPQPARRDAKRQRIATNPQPFPRDVELVLTLALGPCAISSCIRSAMKNHSAV